MTAAISGPYPRGFLSSPHVAASPEFARGLHVNPADLAFLTCVAARSDGEIGRLHDGSQGTFATLEHSRRLTAHVAPILGDDELPGWLDATPPSSRTSPRCSPASTMRGRSCPPGPSPGHLLGKLDLAQRHVTVIVHDRQSRPTQRDHQPDAHDARGFMHGGRGDLGNPDRSRDCVTAAFVP